MVPGCAVMTANSVEACALRKEEIWALGDAGSLNTLSTHTMVQETFNRWWEIPRYAGGCCPQGRAGANWMLVCWEREIACTLSYRQVARSRTDSLDTHAVYL